MHKIFIALSLVTALLASCKDKKDEFAAQEVKLEVYKRDVAPKRRQLDKSPPSWLATPPACPLQVLPEQFVEPGFSLDECAGDKLEECLDRCKNSVVSACYSAALVLQSESPEDDKRLSTPLFARACQLGDASACTNWASTLDNSDPSQYTCLRDTFKATCQRGQDPWGCTMYSYALASQSMDETTLGTIRSLAGTACRFGEEDPACQAMRELLNRPDGPSQEFRDGGAN
tara:strand:- start:20946 stop:21635 length:690 start_codon:yes stop_codon:yes gene_type:complete